MNRRILAAALLCVSPALVAQKVPEGFTDITPGPGLKGWHRSATTSHGNTAAWTVQNGVVSGTQDKPGNGGIILTDKKYRNFEVYLEMNPDFGCDSGLFLRASEKGEAYQVMLDYLEGGNMGGVYGEALQNVTAKVSEGWEKLWKKGQWNSIRARIEGVVPHIQVWMNGTQVTDFTDTANHLPGAAAEGMIALQVHGGDRCKPGLYHRFRAVGVKEF